MDNHPIKSVNCLDKLVHYQIFNRSWEFVSEVLLIGDSPIYLTVAPLSLYGPADEILLLITARTH